MPRTQPELDRNEKRARILAVARRLFAEAGYDATSMGRLAEEAGVAPNTIYWYFADKDALLVAVLEAQVAEALRDFQGRRKSSLEDQVMWVLGVLEEAASIIATVHARAAASETVRVWHDTFHRMLEAMLQQELHAVGVASADLSHAARVATFVIEGLLAHPSSTKDRRGLVRWLIAQVRITAKASS